MKHRHIKRPDGPIIAALLVLLICIRLTFLFYETVYKDTPDYSFFVITKAVETGDSTTFTSLVDDKEMAGQLFDAIVSNGNGMDSLSILQFVWSPMRQEFVANSHALIESRFQKDLPQEKKDEMQSLVTRQFKTMGCVIPIDGWHIADTHWASKIDDDHAKITVDAYNETLGATIPCTFVMTRRSQGHWAITAIEDAEHFVQAIRNAWAAKLEAYNAPIQQEIQSIVTIGTPSAHLVETDDGRTFLRITYRPVFSKDAATIKEIHGHYELCQKGDGTVLYERDLVMTNVASGKTYTRQFLLNPMLPSQDAIIRRPNLDDTYSTITIWSLVKQDGTSLSLSDRLPEKE